MISKKTAFLVFSREKFDEAFLYASELHRQQTRKGNGPVAPFMVHLMSVASLVAENVGDPLILKKTDQSSYLPEDVAIAAMLHDAIEDQGEKTSFQEIETRFGKDVAEIVDWCSEYSRLENGSKPKWEMRKMNYIKKQETAPLAALVVSCCDKIHNLRSMLASYYKEGDELWSVFSRGPALTISYYNVLRKVYHIRLKNTDSQHLLRIYDGALKDIQNATGEFGDQNSVFEEFVKEFIENQ